MGSKKVAKKQKLNGTAGKAVAAAVATELEAEVMPPPDLRHNSNDDEGGNDDDDNDSLASLDDPAESRPPRKGRKTLQGGASMASAFAEILDHPGPANHQDGAPILLGSKSVAKRKQAEVTASGGQSAAKKLRVEMKQRGHEAIPRKGEDPEHDAIEKALLKTATRGVVQLFNAVSKAQKKASQEGSQPGSKDKAGKGGKAGFFSELEAQAAKSKATAVVPTEKQPAKAARKGAAQKPGPGRDVAEGWDVLQDGYAGLQGDSRTKMKDWDKEIAEGALPNEAGLSGSDSELEGLEAW